MGLALILGPLSSRGKEQICLKTEELGAEMEVLIYNGSSSVLPNSIVRTLLKRHRERLEGQNEEGN